MAFAYMALPRVQMASVGVRENFNESYYAQRRREVHNPAGGGMAAGGSAGGKMSSGAHSSDQAADIAMVQALR